MSTGISQIRECLHFITEFESHWPMFCNSIGNGSWVTAGVTTNDVTTRNTKTDSVTKVQCTSTHLTSFAVLVDVAGGLEVN